MSPRILRAQRPKKATLLAAVFAVAVWGLCGWVIQPAGYASSDFYAFWAAARLGDSRVYDPSAIEAVQQTECPAVAGKRFIRPAFEALALSPLGRVPFRAAYGIWFAVNVAACLGLAFLWKLRASGMVAAGLFLPLLWSFGLGQDAPLILLAFATGVRLLMAGRPGLAGVALAASLVKPNIFYVTPVILAARRQLRALATMAATGFALTGLAMLAAGTDWPARFIQAAMENERIISPNIVGLAGLLSPFDKAPWLRLPLAAVGALFALLVTRRQNLDAALYAGLAAGVVFGPRAMIYDGVFLLPVLLRHALPGEIIVAGAALGLAVTPLRPLVQLASPLWLCLHRLTPSAREVHAHAGPQGQAP